jgi:hypothetical protein
MCAHNGQQETDFHKGAYKGLKTAGNRFLQRRIQGTKGSKIQHIAK